MSSYARRRGAWLIVLALLAAGAAMLWPHPDHTSPTPPAAHAGASSTAPNPAATAPRPGDGSVTPPAAPSLSPSVSTPGSALDPARRAPGAPMDAGPADPAEPLAPPTIAARPGSTAARAAVERATRFVRAYARPTQATPAAAWWAAVTPHLSPQAVEDYRGTDPATVPWDRVTGPGRLVPLGNGTEAVLAVAVPTDAGPVTVHLVPGPARGWVVTRAVLPDGPA
ncbi:hypothetical protein [Intrasporangium sp.]|uniref:hypothetical protein n=1 Tax=Intrasporangium sp. TaxID=1925024 RepID=UPI0032217A7E